MLLKNPEDRNWFGPKQTYKVLFSVIDGKKTYDKVEGYELLHGNASLDRVIVYQVPGVSFRHGPDYWTAVYLETGKHIPTTDSDVRTQTAIRALQRLKGQT